MARTTPLLNDDQLKKIEPLLPSTAPRKRDALPDYITARFLKAFYAF